MIEPEELHLLGKLYCDRGDFDEAIHHLRTCLLQHSRESVIYVKSLQLLIRIYAEREDYKSIQHISQELSQWSQTHSIPWTSRMHYTFGVCEFYRGDIALSEGHFKKAFEISLLEHNVEDQCYARSGLIHIHVHLDRAEQAMKEIQMVQLLLDECRLHHLYEVRISLVVLQSKIWMADKKFALALEKLWEAYELVREHKTMTLHIAVVYHLGLVYQAMGDFEMAKIYLSLALKMTDPVPFVHLYKKIEQSLKDVKDVVEPGYHDLVIRSKEKKVLEKEKGLIDFNNQFILLDMLKVFAQSQGKIYTKEDLVREVWQEAYDPLIHDNKLYVNIKRLRTLIEPDSGKPKYIMREKKGYSFNRSVKVMFENKEDIPS